MCSQKIEEKKSWNNIEDIEKEYHMRQYIQPYRSTEVFIDWLENTGILTKNSKMRICDMACGEGANLRYMSLRFPDCKFKGIELNHDLIKQGGALNKISNCSMQQGDWYNLDAELKNEFDGIISFQTLSWLPEYKEAIKCLTDLNPKWIAISSLFYEGDIDYTIQLKDYTRGKDSETDYKSYYYNIYSIVRIKKIFSEYGYSKFYFKPFDIDIDLEKPDREGLGTYTIKTEKGKRIQISGGLMLPWYFIIAEK